MSQIDMERASAKTLAQIQVFEAARRELLRKWEQEQLAKAQVEKLRAQDAPLAPYEQKRKYSARTRAIGRAIVNQLGE